MKGRDGVINGRYEKARGAGQQGRTGSDKTRARNLWDEAVVSDKELNYETRKISVPIEHNKLQR